MKKIIILTLQTAFSTLILIALLSVTQNSFGQTVRSLTASGTLNSESSAKVNPLDAIQLTVAGGNGSITSVPAGINCGTICTFSFGSGTSVTLTASAFPGYIFKGWAGSTCSGTGTCTVVMDNAKNVQAIFEMDADRDGVGVSVDCNDNNAAVWQSATFYNDADGDGYDAGTTTVCYGANIPAGYSRTSKGTDCNDNNARIFIPPAAPTGNATQTFCSGLNPKISDLVVTGSNIIWYNEATAGKVINITTTIADGSHYYASQVMNGCESRTRLDIKAVVNLTPPAPTGNTSQKFGNTSTIAGIVAIGSNIKWYSAASGGSLLPAATPIVNGNHYYASQTVNGCESSSRLDVTAAVITLLKPIQIHL
jgi:Ig-like domain CHU_C associated/Divergent InlB B-repeat domain